MKALLHWGLVVAALGYLAYQTPKLVRSADEGRAWLAGAQWSLVALAVLLNLGAVALYGELHRQLLLVGDARVPAAAVQGTTFAENAVNNTVPVVGGAGSLAYAITRFRRWGADSALASWAVLLAGVLTTLWLLVLGTAGLAVAGRLSPEAAGVVVTVIVVGVPIAWLLLTHPTVLTRLLHPVLRLAAHLPHRCSDCRASWATDLPAAVERVTARIALLRPSPLRWLLLFGIAAGTWALDFAGLVASAAAVLPQVPWTGLVIGFLLVQVSIALQVLPGGAGLAEVGLLGALGSAGVDLGPAAAVVVLYRAASWLVPTVVGWLLYAVQIHVTRPLPHLHRPTPQSAAG
ncbi:MAG: putative heme transporter [Pseudonocardiales bacterium]|nr:putative heme transporter [Pseudonocardiales bacterium]